MTSSTDVVPGRAEVPFVARLGDFGDRPALITAAATISYRELAARIADVAGRLGTARRLVMIAGGNDVDTLVAYLAALSANHPVMLVPGGNRLHLEAMTTAYDPDVVVSRAGTGLRLDERHPFTVHDLHRDLALLLTTSGSTGSPKLVRLSHENLQANAESIATYLGIVSTDRAATTLPLHYCYGLSVLHSHLLRGAALILTDWSVVDPCFWDLFRTHRGTTFAGVPYTFDQLDRVGFDRMRLPSLRYVTQAGGRLPPEQVTRYTELGRRQGWELYVMYGQTEATARMAYLPPELATTYPEAVGVPIPGGSFTLMPADGAEPGVGELVYAGPNVMLGYAESPADLALGRTVDVLRTGDLAREVDGVYQIVGRRGRIAKIFGLRIDLHQVETALGDEGVEAWCADGGDDLVVAVRDPSTVRNPSAIQDPSAIRDLIRQRFGLPPTAVRVCVVDEPPRQPSGKPDYHAIAQLPDTAEPAATPPDPSTTAGLRDLYARLLNRSDVTDDSTFVSLGGDSLSYVEMSIRLEDALGTLPTDWHTTPIRDLVPRRRRHAIWKRVETNVALRAAAIIVIVATHAHLLTLRGGAHALMAIAGFNVGRFHLTDAARSDRVRHLLTSAGRIVAPSVVWIAGAAAVTEHYTLTNVVLLDSVLGPDEWSSTRHFWFIEAIVYTVLALALLMSVPALHRAERAWPFWFPVALTGMGLLTRYEVVLGGDELRAGDAHVIFWLFTLGWATAKANSGWHRLLLSGLIVLTVPGFFDVPSRDAVVMAAMLLLVWLPTVTVPAPLARLAGVLAASSLYIYLTHWQVYPYVDDYSPLLAVVASVLLGIAYWKLTGYALGRLAGLRRSRADRR